MIRLHAIWDDDALVWVVTSPDVIGLVTTAIAAADIKSRAANIIFGLTGKKETEFTLLTVEQMEDKS